MRNGLQPREGVPAERLGTDLLHALVLGGSRAPLHWTIDAGLEARFPCSRQIPGLQRWDFGSINLVVADQFPRTSFAYTGYSRDYNYSRFSYESFSGD